MSEVNKPQRILQKRRNSSRSISSASSSTSEISSASGDAVPGASPRRQRRQRKRRTRSSRRMIKRLSKQLDNLQNYIFRDRNAASRTPSAVSVADEIEGAPRSRGFAMPPPATELVEPKIPRPPAAFLGTLKRLQRFGSAEWCNVRYSKVSKEYIADPGFKELSENSELSALDPASPQLASVERALAAITHAALKERDLLQSSLQELINWGHDGESALTPDALETKISDLFGGQGLCNRVSDDLLQIACGKRAEIIETRRNRFLKMLKNKHDVQPLAKIPPSASFLFEEAAFSSELQRLGGVSKCFKMPSLPTGQLTQPHSGFRDRDFTLTKSVSAKRFVGGSREKPFRAQRADPERDPQPSTSGSSRRGKTNQRRQARGQTSRRHAYYR
jgi:hypothetical protein